MFLEATCDDCCSQDVRSFFNDEVGMKAVEALVLLEVEIALTLALRSVECCLSEI